MTFKYLNFQKSEFHKQRESTQYKSFGTGKWSLKENEQCYEHLGVEVRKKIPCFISLRISSVWPIA